MLSETKKKLVTKYRENLIISESKLINAMWII